MRHFRLVVLVVTYVLVLAYGTAALAQDALQKLEETMAAPAELPAPAGADSSNVPPGYLGMKVDLMKPDGKSVFIVSVVEGGPAAQGGLKADDVILEINGQKVTNFDDLDRMVRQKAGTKLAFKVRRDGVPQRFEVVLAARDASRSQAPSTLPGAAPQPTVNELPAPAPSAAGSSRGSSTTLPPSGRSSTSPDAGRPVLGIRVMDASGVSDAERRRFGITVDAGAVISGLTEGAPAARAGLPIGGVVVSINGRRIGSAQDIVDVIRTFVPGQEIEVTYWEGDRMGRKKVRVGSSGGSLVRSDPTDRGSSPPPPPRPRLRRRSGERPILNMLERILDDVAPPAGSAGAPSSGAMPTPPPPPPRPSRAAATPDSADSASEPKIAPPPPPWSAVGSTGPEQKIDVPAAELPEPGKDLSELESLRKQAVEMQKQLDALLKRIKELEAKKR